MKRIISFFCLITCTLIWGTTFVAQDTGMEVILNGNTLEAGIDQDLSMILEREIALLGFVVVTVQTMAVQKLRSEVLVIAPRRFAGRVDVRSLSRRAEHSIDRHPEGEGQLVHAITSLSGPEPESNLAAIFSDML